MLVKQRIKCGFLKDQTKKSKGDFKVMFPNML